MSRFLNGKDQAAHAASLDGFVADLDSGVSWLFTEGHYGYTEFFDSVEILIMGRRTYEQVLGFGEWPYEGKPTCVFTRSAPLGEHPHVEFVSGEVISRSRVHLLHSPNVVEVNSANFALR